MMLVLKNLGRHRWRSLLTVMSVAVALFLFCMLRSVITTLDDSAEIGSETRLVTRSAISLVFPLPQAYKARIEALEEVRSVSWGNWFGGVYIDERNFFAQFAVDPESYLDLYPEMMIPEDQLEAFLGERTAALVGPQLMKRFGWEVGQNVTLRGTIYPGEWTFTVRAVYAVDDPSFGEETFFFHYDYLYEQTGGQVSPGWFVLEIHESSAAAAMCEAIDDLFRNSAQSTKTQTERAFQAGFVQMYGNIGLLLGAIGTAVLFAILLVCANTMMMSARERTREVAILKTLGFPDLRIFGVVMTESVVIAGLGGVLGIAVSLGAGAILSDALSSMLPGFEVKGATAAAAALLALGLGLSSGLIPAIQAARSPIVRALGQVE